MSVSIGDLGSAQPEPQSVVPGVCDGELLRARAWSAMPRAPRVSATFVLCMAAACEVEPPMEWKLLDAPLASAEAVEFTVVAPRAGPHQVILQFAWPIADPDVEAVVSAAAATTGEAAAPRFDVSWQILRDRVAVCERQSPQQSTGVVDTATSGLGAGPLTSRGLVLGGCTLPAAGQYTLRVVPGPQFSPTAKAHPRVVVAYQPYAIGVQ